MKKTGWKKRWAHCWEYCIWNCIEFNHNTPTICDQSIQLTLISLFTFIYKRRLFVFGIPKTMYSYSTTYTKVNVFWRILDHVNNYIDLMSIEVHVLKFDFYKFGCTCRLVKISQSNPSQFIRQTNCKQQLVEVTYFILWTISISEVNIIRMRSKKHVMLSNRTIKYHHINSCTKYGIFVCICLLITNNLTRYVSKYG